MSAPSRRWITRGVVGIVLATFFSDVGHEMVTAVLPMYLGAIGLGPAALGIMEGAADLAFSLSKLAGGVAGHHVRHKRLLASGGYSLTAAATAAIALTSSAFGLGAMRIAAWFGRGFRSPLRDFLLADEVEATHFGRAYGIERSADMLGAVAGPLLALALLAMGSSIRAVIGLSIVPAALAVVFIAGLTRDRVEVRASVAAAARRPLPRKYWLFLIGVLLFGLGDFSRTFLIFLAASAVGGDSTTHGALTAGVIAYTAHNVVSGIAAFPVGRVADRTSKWKLLACGYALGVLTNALLAGTSRTLSALVPAIIGSGVYIAIEETIEKATIADLLPREQRSLGFGILACANAVGDMVSSLYVGVLLSAGRPALGFGIAALFGACGAVWIGVVGRRHLGSEKTIVAGS